MIWIAPTAKDPDNAALRRRLWDAADQFHANSGLKAHDAAGILYLPAEARFDYLVNYWADLRVPCAQLRLPLASRSPGLNCPLLHTTEPCYTTSEVPRSRR